MKTRDLFEAKPSWVFPAMVVAMALMLAACVVASAALLYDPDRLGQAGKPDVQQGCGVPLSEVSEGDVGFVRLEWRDGTGGYLSAAGGLSADSAELLVAHVADDGYVTFSNVHGVGRSLPEGAMPYGDCYVTFVFADGFSDG